jgi:hypothetical protein
LDYQRNTTNKGAKMNRREESLTVRNALSADGIKSKVNHGTGTAWGWLEIHVERGMGHSHEGIIKRVQEVTGRHGEYDGNINIYYNL